MLPCALWRGSVFATSRRSRAKPTGKLPDSSLGWSKVSVLPKGKPKKDLNPLVGEDFDPRRSRKSSSTVECSIRGGARRTDFEQGARPNANHRKTSLMNGQRSWMNHRLSAHRRGGARPLLMRIFDENPGNVSHSLTAINPMLTRVRKRSRASSVMIF